MVLGKNLGRWSFSNKERKRLPFRGGMKKKKKQTHVDDEETSKEREVESLEKGSLLNRRKTQRANAKNIERKGKFNKSEPITCKVKIAEKG